MKNIIINKSNNIIKKIFACFLCHSIIKKKIKKINNKKFKKIYIKLKEFKLNIKYNINMNNIIKNLKNKYIIELSKYLKIIKNIKNIKIKKW